MKSVHMKAKRPARRGGKWIVPQLVRRGASKSKHDWTRANAMTDEEVYKAAVSDPDAQPLTPADTARIKRTPQVKVIRRALNLSQQEFADCYGIPVGTLRDWEQGRVEPDQATRSYLKVIARDPKGVQKVFLDKTREEDSSKSPSRYFWPRVSNKTRRTFHISRDARGEWRWKLIAANGRLIATSAEGYKNKRDCVDAIDQVKEAVEAAA
jgi:putative transcriptional regulator